MKVLMLNTFDNIGGAARAAVRLQSGLRGLGIDSELLVQFKGGDSDGVFCSAGGLTTLARRLKIFLGLLPVRFYPNKPENNFSPALLPDHKASAVAGLDPDIIHLHWLGAGFLQVETISKLDRLGKPILWTLHDSWPFTGGCHVPYDCTKYVENCGACPVLGSSRERDLSRRTWERKKKAWQDLNLTLIAPSNWLADCARASSLFRNARVEVIPNGLDTEIFQPQDRENSRKLLDLPNDRKLILFGAMRATTDPNKGFQLLAQALQTLGQDLTTAQALVFGNDESAKLPDLGIPVICLGRIENEQRLAAIYSAADVFVAPSRQEAFCQTAAEAMACGTPVVAFGASGLLDVVEHQRCGYLAQPYEPDDLAQGISWVLEDRDRHAELSRRARQKAEEEFSQETMARRYLNIYQEILEQS